MHSLKEMQMQKGRKRTRPQAAGSILGELVSEGLLKKPLKDCPAGLENGPLLDDRGRPEPSGRYDFDLAEFPLFRFCKPHRQKHDRGPLAYTDVITGTGGESITREWKVFPGP